MKEIALKDIMEVIEKVGLPEYPKYLGNGLWQLADGCITGENGLEAFDKAVLEQLKREYKEFRDEPPSMILDETYFGKLTFKIDKNESII